MRQIVKNTLARFLLAIAVVVLGACADTSLPLPTTPALYEMYKVQSADHWDTIANEVANRIQKTLEDRPDLLTRPLYLAPPNDGIFVRSFASLLRSRIVSKGMQLSEYQEVESVVIQYNVQTVLHDSTRGDSWPSLADLGIGIAGSFTSGRTHGSDHEVIINTYIVHENRYAMSLSQVCYINDADWELYFDPSVLRRASESADSIWQRYVGRGQSFGIGTIGADPITPYPIPQKKMHEDALLSGNTYPPATTPKYDSGYSAQSSAVQVTPIVEEYVMLPGGRRVNPSSPPASMRNR